MSVVIETTLGDITVDLFLDQRPITCLNFLKLCKMKYYNFNLFHSIRSGFIAQTGDPSGEGSGGESVWGLLDGPDKRFFSGEKMPKIRHTDAGLLSMVCTGEMMVGSQFFFTLGPDLDSLDGVHCVIGEVAEGHEILRKLNDVICDETHRPYQDVRITHTVVLEDPFSDPPGLRAPSRSPSPSAERLKGGRIAPDEELDETQGKSAAEVQEMIEEKEAKARATILEIVGDLPDADIAPPENVLFVCKLNPVTTDEDLEIIFSRFGKIVSCEVIRDKKTGDSLQYAFIEFSDKKSCEDAYFKMDNVLIDDRRIHVDFSQSVSKMRWLGKGRGVQHFKDGEEKDAYIKRERSNRSRSKERGDHKQHSRNKYSESRRNDDKQSRTVSDKQYKNDRNVTKSRSHRERSRSRSKTENSSKNNKSRPSHNEDKATDIQRDSTKTRLSNQKTEISNRIEEDRSRSRYEEKSRNKNYDRSESRSDDKSQRRNPIDHDSRRDNKLRNRQDNVLETREDNQRSRNDTREPRKEEQQLGRNQEIPKSVFDGKHGDSRDQYNNPNARHERDITEHKQRKRRDERSISKDQSRTESKSRVTNKDQSDDEKDPETNYKEKQSSRNEKQDEKHENSHKRKYEERQRTANDNEPCSIIDKNRNDRYDKSGRNKVEDKYENRLKERKETTESYREKHRDDKGSGEIIDIEVRRHDERLSNRHKDEDRQQTHKKNRDIDDNIHTYEKKSQYQNEHGDTHRNRKTKEHDADHDNKTKDEGKRSVKRQDRKERDGSQRHKDIETNDRAPKNKKMTVSEPVETEKCDREQLDKRTPTPSERKRSKKGQMKNKELMKGRKAQSNKKKSMKKKRKPSSSESSDTDTSDTSDSSSSSDTSTSSSDTDHKKRKSRKRKSSSSSSSTDSSSSSSDTTTSDTSSSSSDSDLKKKNIKRPKQTENKPKRK